VYVFGRVDFFSVVANVIYVFQSFGKPSASLCYVVMVACVTFQCLYATIVELVLLVAVVCKVLHLGVVDLCVILRSVLLNVLVTALK
jgi:hypothetical protein